MLRSYQPLDLLARLENKIAVGAGCWLWTGAIASNGYGMVQIGTSRAGSQIARAHRVVYEVFKGEIPEGLVLDHLCRIKHCVRPDHLEPVTQAENLRRARS